MSLPPVRSSVATNTLGLERGAQLMYALSEQTLWNVPARGASPALLKSRRGPSRQLHAQIACSSSHIVWGASRPSVVALDTRPRPEEPKGAARCRRTTCQANLAPTSSSTGSEGQQNKLLSVLQTWWQTLAPPRWLWRTSAACVLGGQAIWRIATGKAHFRNTIEQLKLVGPNSLGVAMLTSSFVGMVFTIQFVREFAKLGLTRSVGGVLGLALSRELTPVITCIILAGRVGSAFAAELGTMQVSEQVDSLRVLGSDPVNYLVAPRVLACMLAGPALNIFCFVIGLGASVVLANTVYGIHPRVIIDSAAHAVTAWDLITSMIKAWVFGVIISVVSCSWGFTTTGGAKGVGESTTSAVVISLVLIFIADFGLSFLFFQGQGDALRQCSGSS